VLFHKARDVMSDQAGRADVQVDRWNRQRANHLLGAIILGKKLKVPGSNKTRVLVHVINSAPKRR
jgi:hypothetical protein